MKFRDWVAAAVVLVICYLFAFHAETRYPRLRVFVFLCTAGFFVPIAMAMGREFERGNQLRREREAREKAKTAEK